MIKLNLTLSVSSRQSSNEGMLASACHQLKGDISEVDFYRTNAFLLFSLKNVYWLSYLFWCLLVTWRAGKELDDDQELWPWWVQTFRDAKFKNVYSISQFSTPFAWALGYINRRLARFVVILRKIRQLICWGFIFSRLITSIHRISTRTKEQCWMKLQLWWKNWLTPRIL